MIDRRLVIISIWDSENKKREKSRVKTFFFPRLYQNLAPAYQHYHPIVESRDTNHQLNSKFN